MSDRKVSGWFQSLRRPAQHAKEKKKEEEEEEETAEDGYIPGPIFPRPVINGPVSTHPSPDWVSTLSITRGGPCADL